MEINVVSHGTFSYLPVSSGGGICILTENKNYVPRTFRVKDVFRSYGFLVFSNIRMMGYFRLGQVIQGIKCAWVELHVGVRNTRKATNPTFLSVISNNKQGLQRP